MDPTDRDFPKLLRAEMTWRPGVNVNRPTNGPALLTPPASMNVRLNHAPLSMALIGRSPANFSRTKRSSRNTSRARTISSMSESIE